MATKKGAKTKNTAKNKNSRAKKSAGKKPVTRKKSDMRLNDLLYIKLQSLYDVENELVKALKKMAAAATDPELKQGFLDHQKETVMHVERLEQAFELLDVKAKKLKVEAIRGLVNDAAWVMHNVGGKEALDANLIAAAAYVEHYEMAGYMNACEWARELGLDPLVAILSATLAEEKGADEKMRALAIAKINGRVLPSSSEGN